MIVLKITFKPDIPVAVFMEPAAISSKGHKRPLRRSGMNRRQLRDAKDHLSIPDTEGGIYSD